MTDPAKEARDLRSEVDRLTGLLAHIREHILADENFDADELEKDIAGSVDLSEYDRLMRRAETAKAAGLAEGLARAAGLRTALDRLIGNVEGTALAIEMTEIMERPSRMAKNLRDFADRAREAIGGSGLADAQGIVTEG